MFLVPLMATAQTNQIFIPNLGQILTTDSTPTARSFYAQIPGGTVYFSEDTVSFVYAQIDTSEATDDTLYRFDMRFISPFGTPAFRGTDTSDFYYNFYYPHCDTGITGVRLLGQLDVDQIWQGVDLSYISTDDGYLTRLTVAPEWGTSAIQWRFDGLDSAKIGILGELQLHTPLGMFLMPPPIAYSGNDTFTAIYTRNGSSFGIAQQGWSGLQPMYVEWGGGYQGDAGNCDDWITYFGGGHIDEVLDVFTSGTDVYYIGRTYSTVLPTATGASIYSTNQGQQDCFISKFDADGNPLWGTFYGGSDLDQATRGTAFSGDNDNIAITGTTFSSNFPKTTPLPSGEVPQMRLCWLLMAPAQAYFLLNSLPGIRLNPVEA